MKKRNKHSHLISLYLAYHLNKIVLILLLFSFSGLALVFFINTGLPLVEADYALNFQSYHSYYFEQSLFFMQIINSVLVAFFIGTEVNKIRSFDVMFVSNNSRIRLILAKISASISLILIIVALEVGILYLVACICFKNYQVEIADFKLIIFLLFPLIEFYLFGEFIASIFNSYFVPILIFVVEILILVLQRNSEVAEVLNLYLPMVSIRYGDEIIFNMNIFNYFGICSLLFVGTILIFQKKDICN